MATFNNFESLIKHINKKVIPDIQKKEVFEEVRDVYQKHIQSDIYDAYSPTSYTRRMNNGGLIADENIIGEVNNNTLEVIDIAPLNDSESTRTYNSPNYLAQIIENGTAYSGNAIYLFDKDMSGEPWANPRPFTQNTINDLQANKQHIKALKIGFKRNGFKTE